MFHYGDGLPKRRGSNRYEIARDSPRRASIFSAARQSFLEFQSWQSRGRRDSPEPPPKVAKKLASCRALGDQTGTGERPRNSAGARSGIQAAPLGVRGKTIKGELVGPARDPGGPGSPPSRPQKDRLRTRAGGPKDRQFSGPRPTFRKTMEAPGDQSTRGGEQQRLAKKDQGRRGRGRTDKKRGPKKTMGDGDARPRERGTPTEDQGAKRRIGRKDLNWSERGR